MTGAVLQWEPTGNLTVADSLAFPAFIDTFATAMHAAMPPLELHVYAGWEHQAAIKHGYGSLLSKIFASCSARPPTHTHIVEVH